MRCLVRWAVLSTVIGATVPFLWAEEKASGAERVSWSSEVAGVLKQVDASKLTLQVDVPKIQRSKNNNKIGGKGKKKGNNRAPQRIQVDHKDIDLPVANHLTVRLAQPPSAFDDKGNIKNYTAKELQEMKGPANLPGYTAQREDLRVGQTVKLFLHPPKPTADKEKGASAKAEVVMVEILAQPQGPVKGQKKK